MISFKQRHFKGNVILMLVRWYVAYTLSYRDKVKGKWVYLYRAVDKEGQLVDFMLSERRGELSARSFFNKASGFSTLSQFRITGFRSVTRCYFLAKMYYQNE